MITEALPASPRIATGVVDRRHIQAAWTVWAVGCVALMVITPGEETIPYHLGWAGFALAFGLGTWSRRQLVTALAWYTLLSGAVLVRSWLLGSIDWGEITEIPLMSLLAVLMVWNVLRRQHALIEVSRLADREVSASHDRERLMQLTSHELRTPLTIARGYIELMQSRATEPEDLEDLEVVISELDRLGRVSDRLIRVIELQDDAKSDLVDIDAVLRQALERWQVVSDRRWVLDSDVGSTVVSGERLRTCIDTLVENAIRYTSVGDTIRLVGSRRHQYIVLGVLDSGTGLTEQQVLAINAHEQPSRSGVRSGTGRSAGSGTAGDLGTTGDSATRGDPATTGASGPGLGDHLAGTGLGLSIVREIARARGGGLYALHAPEGGAAMTIALPLRPPARV